MARSTRLRPVVLLVGALASLGSSAPAYDVKQLLDARFDPRLVFTTLETPHFRIHYAAGLDARAHHLARLAEPVHRQVTRRLGWEPRRKTDVVLVDESDRTNAFTVTYPTTQILINAAPPLLSQAIFHYGDWLRWLLVHEYTHVVHQDRVGGVWSAVRPVAGAFARPNMLHPTWLKEGLAVLLESEFDSSGRADSPTYRMVLRGAEEAGELGSPRFGSLASASYQRGERWPWILRSYLWGSVLVQTMERSRPGSLPSVVAAGARGLPGYVGPALRQAGLTPRGLQDAAVDWTRARARAEISAMSERPVTPVDHLTTDGYGKFGLAVEPSGNELIYTRERPEKDNALVLLTLGASGDVLGRRDLFGRQNGYQVSHSRSGRFIAFDDVDAHEKYNLWSDLYLLDRDEERVVLRSGGLRGRDPDIHPDGRTLAFVRTLSGTNRISICDSAFGGVEDLHVPEGASRLAEPRWSPDGSRLVFIEHVERTGGDRLMLWEGGSVRALTDGRFQDRDPSWSPDGVTVLFSSDRTGAFQVHALEVASGRTLQVTHRTGGALWPVADRQGRFLFFLDYSARGWDVVRTAWDPTGWWEGGAEEGPADIEPRPVEPEPIQARPQAYSSWRHLAPSFVRPSVVWRSEGVQWGLRAGGVDPAFHRHYRASVRWDAALDRVAGDLFFYDGRRPVAWTLEAARDAVPVEAGSDRLAVTSSRVRGYLPLGRHKSRLHAFVDLTAEQREVGGHSQLLAGMAAGLDRDLTVRQPNDMVAEIGSRLAASLAVSWRDAAPLYVGRLSYERPLRIATLGEHAVLTLGLRSAFVSWGRGPEYLLYAGGRAGVPFSLTSEFEIPGLPPNALGARRVALASARFSRPLALVDKGFSTVPGHLSRVGLAVRADAACIERAGTRQCPWSVGVELIADIELTTILPLRWTLGVHRGAAPSGGTRILLQAAVLG